MTGASLFACFCFCVCFSLVLLIFVCRRSELHDPKRVRWLSLRGHITLRNPQTEGAGRQSGRTDTREVYSLRQAEGYGHMSPQPVAVTSSLSDVRAKVLDHAALKLGLLRASFKMMKSERHLGHSGTSRRACAVAVQLLEHLYCNNEVCDSALRRQYQRKLRKGEPNYSETNFLTTVVDRFITCKHVSGMI